MGPSWQAAFPFGSKRHASARNAGRWQDAAKALTEALSRAEPTPGGGAAAAVAGAMGCALGVMACGISLKSKKLDGSSRPGLASAAAALARLKDEFLALAASDAAAFERFMEAACLPKDDPGRRARMQEALLAAAEVPLRTARLAADADGRAREALPLAAGAVASDIVSARHLLRAAALCAAENVRINLKLLEDRSQAAGLEGRLAAALEAFSTEGYHSPPPRGGE